MQTKIAVLVAALVCAILLMLYQASQTRTAGIQLAEAEAKLDSMKSDLERAEDRATTAEKRASLAEKRVNGERSSQTFQAAPTFAAPSAIVGPAGPLSSRGTISAVPGPPMDKEAVDKFRREQVIEAAESADRRYQPMYSSFGLDTPEQQKGFLMLLIKQEEVRIAGVRRGILENLNDPEAKAKAAYAARVAAYNDFLVNVRAQFGPNVASAVQKYDESRK